MFCVAVAAHKIPYSFANTATSAHSKNDFANKVEKFAINADMIKYVQNAHKRKCERKNAVKRRKKRKIEDDGKIGREEVKKEVRELDEKLKAVQKMLSAVQEAISCGIKTKDMSKVESGQVLLTEATSRVNAILKAQDDHIIRQKLSKVISVKK